MAKATKFHFVTEEPSIVAASFAAKIIKRLGGFGDRGPQNAKFSRLSSSGKLKGRTPLLKMFSERKEAALEQANCKLIHRLWPRGGGARDFWLEAKGIALLIFYLSVIRRCHGSQYANTSVGEWLTPFL